MNVTAPTIVLPLSVANGGLGLSSYAIGDLIYASAATTLARLADVAVNQVLVSGGVGAAPAWSGTPTLGGLTLGGTLAMAGNAITSTGVVNAGTFVGVTSATVPTVIGGAAVGSSLNLQSTSGVGTTDFIRFLVGSNGGTEALRIIDNGYVGIGITNPSRALDVIGRIIFRLGTFNTPSQTSGQCRLGGDQNGVGYNRIIVNAQSGAGGNYIDAYGDNAYSPLTIDANPLILSSQVGTGIVVIGALSGSAKLDVTAPANLVVLKLAGYSLTVSSSLSMVTQSGTLSTSGVVDVWKLAITDTAHGTGSNIINILGGPAATTALLSLDTTGLLTAVAYKVGTTAGVSGTWTTVDGKTITSTLGLITAIV